MSRHFFVFGVARSGTNLLARMIDRHPSAVCALDPALPYFKSLRNRIIATHAPEPVRRLFAPDAPFQDYYFLNHGPALLDLLLKSEGRLALPEPEQAGLRAAIVQRAALESRTLAESLKRATGEDYKGFLDDILRIIAGTRDEAVWSGAKEVWVIDFLPLLSRMYPDARFFVIERDPRAVVASLLAMAEKDASQAAHFISYARHWRKAVTLSRQFESESGLRDRIQFVSYERLVHHPAEVAAEVCAHLGLPYRPEMLEVSAAGWPGNSSYGDNRGIYGQSLERWRKTLSAAIVNTVEFLCAPEMALTEYQTPPGGFGRLTPEIETTFRNAATNQTGWKSDSGHVPFDVGGELLRYEVLKSAADYEDAVLRECFLTSRAFQTIRARLRGTRN